MVKFNLKFLISKIFWKKIEHFVNLRMVSLTYYYILIDLIVNNRKLMRLSGFDYSANRNYFFTICVKNHLKPFGSIEKKSMVLSENGNIALEQWQWLGNQYPYIDLISFVIMPDHVHGIIYIDTDFYVGNGRDRSLHINLDRSLPINPGRSMQIIPAIPKIKPLPELIGAYNTTVSKRIHLLGDTNFRWQKSYYEHIIRNRQSMNLIKNYIETNPEHWIM
jgi:putative transposase